jgi:SAM-dependent methyltransferase
MGLDADRFREFERTAHDRLSQSYHEFFTPVTALALDRLLGWFEIKPGFCVLDVACGPGGVAAALKRRGAHVTGIDLAPGMVALALRLNPGVKFREGNVEALPFPDKSFNAVVCNFGLGHFPRSEAAVSECVRVLVPSGTVAFSWWDSGTAANSGGFSRGNCRGRHHSARQCATRPSSVPIFG